MCYPKTDNECTLLGWTEALINGPSGSLHVSHAPDADINDTFFAFCHDEQEMIRINGWMMDSYEVIK